MASDASGLTQDGRGGGSRPIGLLVAGMHRSGTSALTRTTNLLGAALPHDLLGARRSNPTGHWESTRVLRLHEEVLTAIGGHWSDWTPVPDDWFDTAQAEDFAIRMGAFLRENFADKPLFVLKDPRICRLAPLWLRAMQLADIDVRVLLPVRRPDEVAASLETRNGFPRSKGGLIWLRHVLDAERHTRGATRFILSYDELLADWRDVMARAADQLGFDWPTWTSDAEAQIDAYLNERHRHHQADDLARAPGEPARWAAKAYRSLTDLGAQPGARKPLKRLDDIAGAFAELTVAAAPLLRDEIAFRDGEAAKALQDAERRSQEALAQAVKAAEARATEATEAIDALRAEATSGNLGVHNHNERISQLQAEIEANTAERAAMRAEVDVAASESRRARRSAELRRREIESLQAQAVDQQQAVDDLRESLEEKRAAVEAADGEAMRWRRAAHRLAEEVGGQVAVALEAARGRELEALTAAQDERSRADGLDRAKRVAEDERALAIQAFAILSRQAAERDEELAATASRAADLELQMAAREAALREMAQRGFWRRLFGKPHRRGGA